MKTMDPALASEIRLHAVQYVPAPKNVRSSVIAHPERESRSHDFNQ